MMSGPVKLFEELEVGALTLPNRVVMAPLTRSRADAERALGDLHAEYYAQRAGAGLIVSEATQISEQGIGYPATPGMHTDAQVAGWRKVTSAVHAAGGRIVAQLWHVGRISLPRYQPGGGPPVSASAVKPDGHAFTFEGMVPFVTPRALGLDEIAGVVSDYARAAARAKEAGFDGVEVHAANGYLIEQFLHTGTNRREDAYGGSVENRVRFLREVTEAVAGVWGADRVGVRVSPHSTGGGSSDADRKGTYGAAAAALEGLGVAYLHTLEPAEGVAPEDRVIGTLRENYSGVIIANAGYDAESGEALLRSGEADAIAYGRLFIANPDLPERFRQGAPLAEPDRATFYGGGAEGYTDYPRWEG
jgi:N-ethylmaleimide reductase